MDRKEIEALLVDDLAGRLSDEDREVLAAALEQSKELRTLQTQLRDLRERGLKEPGFSPGFVSRVIGKIRSAESDSLTARLDLFIGRYSQIALAAAAVVVILLISYQMVTGDPGNLGDLFGQPQVDMASAYEITLYD